MAFRDTYTHIPDGTARLDLLVSRLRDALAPWIDTIEGGDAVDDNLLDLECELEKQATVEVEQLDIDASEFAELQNIAERIRDTFGAGNEIALREHVNRLTRFVKRIAASNEWEPRNTARETIRSLLTVLAEARRALYNRELTEGQRIDTVTLIDAECNDALPGFFNEDANYLSIEAYRDRRDVLRFVMHDRYAGLDCWYMREDGVWMYKATFHGFRNYVIGEGKAGAARAALAEIERSEAKSK